MEQTPPPSLEQLRGELAALVSNPYAVYSEMREQTPTQMVFVPGGVVPALRLGVDEVR
jgi:hypothetical protein